MDLGKTGNCVRKLRSSGVPQNFLFSQFLRIAQINIKYNISEDKVYNPHNF